MFGKLVGFYMAYNIRSIVAIRELGDWDRARSSVPIAGMQARSSGIKA